MALATNATQPSNPTDVIVLKLGGSVLSTEDRLPLAVHEIYRWLREGRRVVAVVSALGGVTDALLQRGARYGAGGQPDDESLASLLATGERQSAALLGLALSRAGVPAAVLDVDHIALKAKGPVLDAEPTSVDTAAILAALNRRAVVIIPGFIASDEHSRTVLLGRGGSDLTALFIGRALAAPVRLLKDVDGLYERDPNLPGPLARRFEGIGYQEAIALDGRIVQHKAVRFAERHQQPFVVARCNTDYGTLVGASDSVAREPYRFEAAPLKVGILGLGTVGLGVFRTLERQPERIAVTRVAVRQLRKHGESGVPIGLLTTDPWEVVEGEAQVIIETIGGVEPAFALIAGALRAGKHVVTANKAVIAAHGRELQAIAQAHDAKLLYGAAVGGALPVLEIIESLRSAGKRIVKVDGIVNGTCNFILSQLAKGVPFATAVDQAQAQGFAEPDPSSDLDGSDALAKAVLIARAASSVPFREPLPEATLVNPTGGAPAGELPTAPTSQLSRTGITGITPTRLIAAEARGGVIKLIASVDLTGAAPVLTVGPVEISATDPLASVSNEFNAVRITLDDGSVVIPAAAKGAGRFPTAEAVVGDVLQLVRTIGAQRASAPVVGTWVRPEVSRANA